MFTSKQVINEARELIKDTIIAKGGKISHFRSREITQAALEWLLKTAQKHRGKAIVKSITVNSRDHRYGSNPT